MAHLVDGALSRAPFFLPMLIRLLVIVVLGIALPAAAMPDSQPFEMDALASTDLTFDAVLDTLQDLKWKATLVTKKSGMIVFNTGQCELNGNARCTAIIVDGKQPGTALIHLAVNNDQAGGLAANSSLADSLFTRIRARLESSQQSLPAASTASGTSVLASRALAPACSPQHNCTISALLTASHKR